MKKVFLLVAIIISLFCNAQDKKYKYGDVALFNKGIAVYELIDEGLYLNNKIREADTISEAGKKERKNILDIKESVLERSLGYFNELIKDYPKSTLYFMALYNKAELENELEDYEAAKKTYIEILNSKANDKDPGGLGSGIMAEPYTNYKNRACNSLATIECNAGNYNEAIKYLTLTEKYPYQHFCGNAVAAQDIYMAQQYAKNYIKLNQKREALTVLMPHILSNGLASNDNLVKVAAKTFKDEYGNEKAKMEFAKIVKSLHHKKIRVGKNGYDEFFVNLAGKEIKIEMPMEAYADTPDAERAIMIEQLNKSDFNKLLNE